MAELSEKGRKKKFPPARKSVLTARRKGIAGIPGIFFKTWISSSRKKSPNKRILFQVDRKSVFTSRNGEFV